jgi:hypothetical protein
LEIVSAALVPSVANLISSTRFNFLDQKANPHTLPVAVGRDKIEENQMARITICD